MAKQRLLRTPGRGADAAADDLKKAYRKLAMQHHPDRNPGDKKAEQKFKDISEAYEVLKDEQKRAAYDRFGHAAFEGGARPGRQSRRFRLCHGVSPTSSTRCSATSRAARAAQTRHQSARHRPALQSRDRARRSLQGPADDDPGADPGAVRGMPRHRRRARLAARHLPDLPRRRPGARAAGLLHHRAHLPLLPRRRPRHRQSVPHLRRPGPRQEGKKAVGHDPGRGRGRHAHPPRRRRRGRRARRRGGRPLYLPQREAASLFQARRRQHPLPRADLDGDRGAGRRDRGADHRRHQRAVTIPAGTQSGHQFRLRGKGMSVLRSPARGDMYDRGRGRDAGATSPSASRNCCASSRRRAKGTAPARRAKASSPG